MTAVSRGLLCQVPPYSIAVVVVVVVVIVVRAPEGRIKGRRMVGWYLLRRYWVFGTLSVEREHDVCGSKEALLEQGRLASPLEEARKKIVICQG